MQRRVKKYDEKYMPPEVSEALKASGRDVSGNRTGNLTSDSSAAKAALDPQETP